MPDSRQKSELGESVGAASPESASGAGDASIGWASPASAASNGRAATALYASASALSPMRPSSLMMSRSPRAPVIEPFGTLFTA